MNASATAPQQQPHPAPYRSRISGLAIWFAILAAPVVWSIQQLLNAGIAAHGCYPHDEPIAHPLWRGLAASAITIDVIAIVVCVVALGVAWRNWRSTQEERAGSVHRLLGSGDGRTRFMAMTGLMMSGLFLLAVLFSTAGPVMLGVCSR